MEEDSASNIHSEISRDPEDGNFDLHPQEKDGQHTSLELTRTASNALSRVTSRITNHHVVDPGPPPGEYMSIYCIKEHCNDGG
jgi:hypothetical protein